MSNRFNIPCPTCDSKGELIASGIRYGEGSSGPYSQMAPCPDCLGKKTLTAEQLKWKERGKNIREWRRAKGLTLIQAANRFGLRVTELSGIESGRIDNSEWENLLKGGLRCDG